MSTSLVSCVLIESDWNLKHFESEIVAFIVIVLIESDWNLKCQSWHAVERKKKRINRIRLEFKVNVHVYRFVCIFVLIESDWNLKNFNIFIKVSTGLVLIESDWNLKVERIAPAQMEEKQY